MIKILLKKYYRLKLKELELLAKLMLELAKYKKTTIKIADCPFRVVNETYEIIVENGEIKPVLKNEELFTRKIDFSEKGILKLIVDTYRHAPDTGIELMHQLIKQILKGEQK